MRVIERRLAIWFIRTRADRRRLMLAPLEDFLFLETGGLLRKRGDVEQDPSASPAGVVIVNVFGCSFARRSYL